MDQERDLHLHHHGDFTRTIPHSSFFNLHSNESMLDSYRKYLEVTWELLRGNSPSGA
jgi:hypothetical protein